MPTSRATSSTSSSIKGDGPDDQFLMQALLGGDAAAMNKLMQRYDRLVRFTIFRVAKSRCLSDPHWVDTIATDTWTGLEVAHLNAEGWTFIDRVGDQRWVARLDPESGEVTRLMAFSGGPVGDLALSPDGRYLLYTDLGNSNADLMLAQPRQ